MTWATPPVKKRARRRCSQLGCRRWSKGYDERFQEELCPDHLRVAIRATHLVWIKHHPDDTDIYAMIRWAWVPTVKRQYFETNAMMFRARKGAHL